MGIDNPAAFEATVDAARGGVRLLIDPLIVQERDRQIRLALAFGVILASAELYMCLKDGDVPIGEMEKAFVDCARDAARIAGETAREAGLEGRGSRA